MSVCDHLVAPGSAGLFRAAILQSGPCQAQADRLTAQGVSIDYAAARGCSDIAKAGDCLRDLPANALTDPPWYYHIGDDSLTGPITGTEELPFDPVSAFADGRAARVPVLMGTTADEFTLFVGLQYLRTGLVPDYPQDFTETFGPQGAHVAARYPLDRFGGDASLAYAAAVTDGVFACPADRMANSLARAAPVFAYEFNDRGAPAADPLRKLPFPVGAGHSLELRYLFDIGGAPRLDPAQRRLADDMVGYWSQFVTTGVPRVPGLADWPKVTDPATGPRMSLQPDGPRLIKTFDDAHQCPFWASLVTR
jgi:para-nitrobenzyl esterase